MFRRYFFSAVFVFLSCFSIFAQNAEAEKKTETTIITINNARQTSYKKAEDTGNDTIVLEGSVSLSVEKGSSKNEIKADKVTYDRQTEMLYAEGNVEIIMKGGSSGGDTASAKSLLLNTSTLEGVFDGGRIVQTQSDALNLPSGSTLIVFSEIFGKGNENVITFKNSSLTFCDEDPPHWHIDATRTWLLPGGEFAFFNALLYVGAVPVMYFPFFWYPKDELIFNPVFGFSKREGYYIQTTTYLLGRKPLDTSSNSSKSSSDSSTDSTSAESLKAVYNFIKPSSLKEQVREGLILHNLDEDYNGDTSHYLKILGDWYSNLGYMFGLDGKLKVLPDYISQLDFNAYLGFSNTVFKADSTTLTYYPYSSSGKTYKDSSSFLGLKLPFRYSANLAFQLSKPFRISVSIPLYSDPFFAYDFVTGRRETMDWISYFLDSTKDSDNTEPTITEVSSFTWNVSSSFSPKIPDFLNPYISSVSLSMTNSVNISSKTTDFSYKDSSGKEVFTYKTSDFEKNWKERTPSKKFYYPSLVTPLSSNVTISGTLFSWPLKKSSSKTPDYVISLNKTDELKTEKQLEEEKKQAEAENAEDSDAEKTSASSEESSASTEDSSGSKKNDIFEYYLADLDYSPSKETVSDTLTYKLNYSVGMNVTMQSAYASNHLHTADDFYWKDIRSSMYNMKLPASLSSIFNYGGNFFTIDNKVSFSPVFQKHTYLSEDATFGYKANEIKKLILSDYKSESRDVINTNAVTLRPFLYVPVISETNVAWNSSIKLYRRNFIGDSDVPDWEEFYADWDDENSITVNSLSADIKAKEMGGKLNQSLKLECVMPPLTKKYTATLSIGVPYVTASLSTGFQEVKNKNKTTSSSTTASSTTSATVKDDPNKKWEKTPLQQNLSVSLFDSKLTMSQSLTYNLEDKNWDSFKVSASIFGVQLSYLMSYTLGYDLDTEKGWQVRKEKEFLPYSLSASYSLSGKTYYKWFNRISFAPALSTSIVADLLRPTNSYFLFSPTIKFKIHGLFDISFSATSRNQVLYWYFHNNEGDLYSDWGGFPGNIFKDLLDSFRFDDEEVRRNSGFKLKSFNMTISHDLHDWKFNMTMKIEPRIITENGKKQYDFKPNISIGVVWNPMESMKTSIVDDYGEWKLE